MAALGLNPLCCILCGALVSRDRQNNTQWMHSFRASEPFQSQTPPTPLTILVYTVNDACDTACVSGVGIRRQGPHPLRTFCRASLSWPRDDASLGGGHGAGHDGGTMSRQISLNWSPHGIREFGEIWWGFPLHSACWDLLTTLRPWGLLDTQAIFDICRSVPPRGGVLLFGHDYGGICEPDSMFATYLGEKPQRMLHKEKPLSFEPVMDETHENPLEVPGLRLIFEEGHNDYPDHCFTNFLMVGGSTENDPFSTLPFEILELIVAELTLEDVSLLKQASQIYANLVLPDTFWRSQFRRGGELEHVFESMEYGSQCKGRWRTIFLRTKELQNNPKMRNRKRVVTLAWALLDLVGRRGQISCSMLNSPPFPPRIIGIHRPFRSAKMGNRQ